MKESDMTTGTKVRPFNGNFTADPIHSSFGFAIEHASVSTFRGTLSDVRASLHGGGDGIALEGAAKAESISIQDPPEFRAHVLGPEFFDIENHPEVMFRSSDVELAENGGVTIEGELTIRGVTRSVTANGTYVGAREGPGGLRGALELSTTFDRRNYGFEWQMELPGGGNAAGWDVTLTVHLELIAAEE
jgi:polyisoprenoid-binding protein YceI